MCRLCGGTFIMESERFYAEERPLRTIGIAGYQTVSAR